MSELSDSSQSESTGFLSDSASGFYRMFCSGIAAVLINGNLPHLRVNLGVAPVLALVSARPYGDAFLSVWAGGFCYFHEKIAPEWITSSSVHDNTSWEWVKYGSLSTLRLIFSDLEILTHFFNSIAVCQELTSLRAFEDILADFEDINNMLEGSDCEDENIDAVLREFVFEEDISHVMVVDHEDDGEVIGSDTTPTIDSSLEGEDSWQVLHSEDH
ncbi:hypothetical protein BJ138DRAFT_1128719 [Hygrophoropsis aurantiaca]|uniref:Uncharacterized protein n=1 Tax=Hygrophoropsis aurantiaca TaxID=72124 RepID=A0ACB8A4C2_9AGAM|nr:hypothetical protein BJ138DRAFT_1128719 [Hygrophoropsis aurantiaca]